MKNDGIDTKKEKYDAISSIFFQQIRNEYISHDWIKYCPMHIENKITYMLLFTFRLERNWNNRKKSKLSNSRWEYFSISILRFFHSLDMRTNADVVSEKHTDCKCVESPIEDQIEIEKKYSRGMCKIDTFICSDSHLSRSDGMFNDCCLCADTYAL